ncbi:MAG: flippase activity-associated protein Agl23 [Ardenticatenaceae bacterium]
MEQSITSFPSRSRLFSFSLKSYLVRNWALLLLASLVLLAIGSRFWDLGSRALHHDESLHAFYSFEFYDKGVYEHDPLMHGPVLFHLTALGYWLFGASDFTSRLMPAILGVFLVWAPWKFRDWLGTKGALATSALILISPTLLYYTRFLRHDAFFVVWTLIIIYGMWKYLDEGQAFHMYLMVAGWALAFSQKEVAFLLAFVFWVFWAGQLAYHYWHVRRQPVPLREMREWHLLVVLGALLLPLASASLLHVLGMDPETGYNAGTYKNISFIQEAGGFTAVLLLIGVAAGCFLWNWRKFLIALGVFYVIFVLFHTTLLTSPFGIGSGMVGALGYWIEQHDVQRGGQPWYYYTLLTPLYEFLPLLIGFFGTLVYVARKRHGQVAPESKSESFHLNVKALWPIFNLWWFFSIFVVLSYAGEKMPWLLTHIALPLAFLGGWVLGKILDEVDWSRVASTRGVVFSLLSAIGLFAFLSILWLTLHSDWPLQGTDEASQLLSARWLTAIILLVGAIWGTIRYRNQLGSRTARQLFVLTFSGLMALATIRFAIIGSFVNGDIPSEPLIYTQSSPDVPMLMREIDMISERIAGGKNLKVAYDSSTSWPYQWYLRDYNNKFYFGGSPEDYADTLRDSPIVLVGPEHNNEQKVRQILPDYIRHHYSMRPNFPEDYKNLRNVYEMEPDPNNAGQMIRVSKGGTSDNPINLLSNIWQLAQQRQARADFLDFIAYRRMAKPLGDYAMWVYIKPDVAAEVWQYGLTVTAMDPELIRDPFAEVIVEVPATISLTDGFTSPKNVAILPDGKLVVADGGNHRIRIIDREGNLISEFGSFGAEPGQFNEPWGLAVAPDGTIYVADTWNHRIQHLDQEGNLLHVWGGYADTGGELTQEGLLWGPRDLAIDQEGNIYVTDTGNKRIQKFDSQGTFLAQFGGGGTEPGQFSEPVGITVAPNGTIYVADTWNRRIQSFSPDFSPLQQIPVRAWSSQNILNKPYIAASDDRIWISDPEGYRLIELNTQGDPLRVWGLYGNSPTQLDIPLGLAFDGERLWLADSNNNRVLGYDIQ